LFDHWSANSSIDTDFPSNVFMLIQPPQRMRFKQETFKIIDTRDLQSRHYGAIDLIYRLFLLATSSFLSGFYVLSNAMKFLCLLCDSIERVRVVK